MDSDAAGVSYQCRALLGRNYTEINPDLGELPAAMDRCDPAHLDALAKLGAKTDVQVIPFGITTSSESQPSFKLATRAYHLGAMDWMPNADGIKWFVEQVWPAIHKVIPELTFTYAGRSMPPAFSRLQGHGVTNAGTVASAQEFTSDKGILIVPLLSGGGIRVKILEAMAAGKLVISTGVGMHSIGEAVPGTHFLPADNPEDFLAALKQVVHDEGYYLSVCRAARQLVESYYNAELIREKIESVFGGLIAGE
jgi:glycosyltransferase involved in cell wall biosynthesis